MFYTVGCNVKSSSSCTLQTNTIQHEVSDSLPVPVVKRSNFLKFAEEGLLRIRVIEFHLVESENVPKIFDLQCVVTESKNDSFILLVLRFDTRFLSGGVHGVVLMIDDVNDYKVADEYVCQKPSPRVDQMGELEAEE